MNVSSGVMLLMVFCFVLVAADPSAASAGASWDDVSTLLQNAIQNHTFPGCVAIVVSAKGTLFAQAFGTLTYDQSSPLVTFLALSL
jgi:hypothetical protein